MDCVVLLGHQTLMDLLYFICQLLCLDLLLLSLPVYLDPQLFVVAFQQIQFFGCLGQLQVLLVEVREQIVVHLFLLNYFFLCEFEVFLHLFAQLEFIVEGFQSLVAVLFGVA